MATIENGYIKMVTPETYSGRVEPIFYRWHSPTAVGHDCVLNDSLGREVFRAKSDAINAVNLKPHPPKNRYVHDLVLATIGSGILEVHFKTLG